MSELSPAARAVLEAVTWKKYDVPPEGLPAFADEMAPLLATALRAAADQVVPTEIDLPPIAPDLGHFRQHERRLTRRKLLAIADELEAQ